MSVLVVLAVCLGTAWASGPREAAAPWGPDELLASPGGPDGGGLRASEYYIAATGSDVTGDGSQGNPWRTIQYAISQVSSGDTIHVAAGTYVETGQIVINKNLAIVGDPASWPAVQPAQDTGSSGDARGWWLVNAGCDLTLRYMVLDGDSPTRKVHQALRCNGTVTADTCEFRNVKYAKYLGMAVVLFGEGTVAHCTFSNIERIGVIAFGTGVTDALIHANTYTGKGDGDWIDYGVELGGGAVATVTNNDITGCTGVASSDGSTSAGILITTYYGAGTAGTLLGNVLSGNTLAIAVGYDGADTSDVVAHYNDVSGCPWGIDNTSSTKAVDAEKNWWGTTDAPTIETLIGGTVDYAPFLTTDRVRIAFSGNRVADLQNNDGGWDWPLDDGNPASTSPVNTLGPIAMGLAKAYRVTSDPDMYAALQNAGALLLTKIYSFSPSDGYLAAELDSLFGGTTYTDHVTTYFYGPLAAGTYNRNNAGTLYDTAGYVNLIRTSRASQGIPNLAAWDVGLGAVAAASCGVTGSELDAWVAGVKGEIDELDGSKYYDVIGLAGAVYALAFVGVDFDPTAGEHAAAGSLADLAAILAGYQIAESGGFAWNRDYVIPYDGNETIQETAYAVLALSEVGGYDTEVAAAAAYMRSVQLSTGGWENYVGSTSGENNEVTAEALWGIWTSGPATLTLEADADCYRDGDTVTVEIWMNEVPQEVVGGQFFLSYDNAKLDFISAAPGEAPFTNELYEVVDEGLGTIDYSVYAPAGGPGAAGTKRLATLTFQALDPICTAAGLVAWRAHDPPTRLSGSQGQAVYPDPVDLDIADDEPPVISGLTVTGGDVDAACEATVTFSATVTDNCCIDPDDIVVDVALLTGNATLGTPSITKTPVDAATVTISGSVLVSDLTGCPATVRVTIDADDCCGNAAATASDTADVNDATAPVISGLTVTGGNVDGACEYTVTFSAQVDDNCCVDDDDVDVVVSLLTGNATLGTPTITKTQVDANTVTISGSVLVSDLTGCPATVQVTIDADDCCGNAAATASDTADVNDATAPVITCPADVTVECDAVPPVGTATAADNCDPAPVVTYDGEVRIDGPCPDSYTLKRTWTATDACGNDASCTQTITVQDTTAPLITCPADISVNADAGLCTAVVDPGTATATDNCDSSPDITATRSDALLLTDPYPQGDTFITWRATDNCGNYAECTQKITVSAYNELAVVVDLQPTVAAGPFTRCITFELWSCAGPTTTVVDAVLTFTGGTTGPATVLVPCGSYDCITARDKLHTLRQKDELFGIVGTQYAASFTGADRLIGGNLNDDKWIDILDFGVYSWKYATNYGTGDTTCSTPYPHADVNGDGIVDTAEFTFIQINFLLGHEANCCGMPGLRDTDQPVAQVSVAELFARGLGPLAAGDLNGDGWLDEQDIAAFAQGARPSLSLGDANCDGAVDFADIDAFVVALGGAGAHAAAYPGCNWLNADANGDGRVDFADIDPLVELLGR